MLRKNIIETAVVFVICSINNTILAQNTYLRIDKVSGGELHTLVLMKNGTLWACGDNRLLQSGIGTTIDETWILLQVLDGEMDTDSGFLENIVAMDGGWKHSLALEPNGVVWAWGTDSEGQLGNGAGIEHSAAPKRVHKGEMETTSDFLEGIVSISAGRTGRHSLAADTEGRVWAWGDNNTCQCGDSEKLDDFHEPILVTMESNIIAVEAGVGHSLALEPNGVVWAWGANGYGQLGQGDTVGPKSTPVRVKGPGGKGFLTNKVAISACNHCLALDPNGHVWAWGNNDNGQLGVGGDTQRCYPVKSDSDGYKYMVEKDLQFLLVYAD